MPLTIAKRKSFNDWIQINEDEDVKLKIDYPSREQSVKLKEILLDFSDIDDMKSRDMYKFMREFIRYTIKDWKGIVDDDGEEIKCVLVKGALRDDLLYDLTSDMEQCISIYSKINEQIKFTEIDKKK